MIFVALDSPYHRITSYNVCYTKLLRGEGSPFREKPAPRAVRRVGVQAALPHAPLARQERRGGSRRMGPCPGAVFGSVITSYSIHYTKLYESLERLILDGRIHPARIEEIVQKVTREISQKIYEEGEKVLFDLA